MTSLEVPELTLGWGVLEWGSEMLAQPDGDDKGATWVYTDEQALFILRFYAIDERGRFIYRRGMLSRPKGWGKSPLVAAICATELLGPVKFDGFDANGVPVGRPAPSPVVQICATAEKQADNTMTLVLEMLGSGPAMNEYNLDLGLSRIRAVGSGTLERITASPTGAEGNRTTFAVLDESHLWLPNNGGIQMSNVIRRNLMKTGGRSIETTNAPVPGQGSVAELTDAAWFRIEEGQSHEGLLYDSVEVYVEDIYDKEQAMPALVHCYGNAAIDNGGWLDLERVWEEINDPATTEADARRFFFNQRVRRGSQWIAEPRWAACGDKELRHLRPSDRIALGFRGRARSGAVGLVACRLRDSAMFTLKTWETDPSVRDDEINHSEVDEYVREALLEYDVKLMYAAPQNWQDIVGRWYLDNEDVVEEFWLSSKAKWIRAIEEFETAVLASRLKHNFDPALTRHVSNSHAEVTPAGDIIIRKASQHSNEFIDVAEAGILAYAAAQEAIERGLDTDGPSRTVYSF
jgi:hypothetical protein